MRAEEQEKRSTNGIEAVQGFKVGCVLVHGSVGTEAACRGSASAISTRMKRRKRRETGRTGTAVIPR